MAPRLEELRRGVPQGMADSPPSKPEPDSERDEAVALIDEEAAGIDARSPDAAEQIIALEVDADELGLPTKAPFEVDVELPDEADDPDR